MLSMHDSVDRGWSSCIVFSGVLSNQENITQQRLVLCSVTYLELETVVSPLVTDEAPKSADQANLNSTVAGRDLRDSVIIKVC